jgi:hypothetical protein
MGRGPEPMKYSAKCKYLIQIGGHTNDLIGEPLIHDWPNDYESITELEVYSETRKSTFILHWKHMYEIDQPTYLQILESYQRRTEDDLWFIHDMVEKYKYMVAQLYADNPYLPR